MRGRSVNLATCKSGRMVTVAGENASQSEAWSLQVQ